jgi:serine/threonine protein kinase
MNPFGLKHDDKVNCLVDVARALRFLHDAGIIHGDIKAENILVFTLDLEIRQYVGLTRYFLAKVTDFGCAHISDGKDVRLPGGTPVWSAPEAKELISPDLLSKTDIYSYGLLVASVMLEQDLYSCFDLSGDRHEQRQSLEVLKRNSTLLEHAERAVRSKNVLKKDLDNTVQVLRRTLLLDPRSRSLDHIEDFFQPRHGEIQRGKSRSKELLASKIPPLYDIEELSLVSAVPPS